MFKNVFDWTKCHWEVPVFLCFATLVVMLPEIDLWVSGLFWSPEDEFIYRNNPFVLFLYRGFWFIPRLIIPLLLIAIAASYFRPYWKAQRKKVLFLLFVLLVGPGLIVHGLKDNWDRGRPRHVEAFGGDQVFSPAFVVSDQCEKNCSFPSGHAAMGFFFMALGWVMRSRRWFWMGVVIGILASMGRILQGGHFFSDVLTSGFIVYFTCQLSAWWLLGSYRVEGKEEVPSS